MSPPAGHREGVVVVVPPSTVAGYLMPDIEHALGDLGRLLNQAEADPQWCPAHIAAHLARAEAALVAARDATRGRIGMGGKVAREASTEAAR